MRACRPLIVSAVCLALFLVGTSAAADEPPYRIQFATPHATAQTCGQDSLYVAARAAGVDRVRLAELENDLHPDKRGVPLAALINLCRKHDIPCTPLRLTPARLSACTGSTLLHVNDSHYITLLGWREGRMLIFDNGAGLLDCTPEFFATQYRWDGTALVVGRMPLGLQFYLYGVPIGAAVAAMLAIAMPWWWFRRRSNQTNKAPLAGGEE